VGFHNTSDNPNNYRDSSEVDAALERDPIGRVARYMLAQRLLSERDLAAIKEEIRSELDAVQRHVATLPRPEPDFMFQHVYDDPPPRFENQRADVRDAG
jgi:pyruvate dehydrogenase E1 component alpha subunit